MVYSMDYILNSLLDEIRSKTDARALYANKKHDYFYFIKAVSQKETSQSLC